MSKMNLLPKEYVKQRLQYRIDMLCVLLFGLVMVSIMTAETISSKKVHDTQVIHASVAARFGEAAEFINNFFVLQRTKNDLLKEAQVISTMSDRVPRSFLLAMITNYCPEDVTLNDVIISERVIMDKSETENKKTRKISNRKTGEAAEKEKEKEPPKTQMAIELTGVSENYASIASLLQAFKLNPLMESVDLEYTREKRTPDLVLLDFKMELVLLEATEVLKLLNENQAVRELALVPFDRTANDTPAPQTVEGAANRDEDAQEVQP